MSKTFLGISLTVSGWGRTSFNGPQPDKLKVGTVIGRANSACASAYSKRNMIITANMICADTASFAIDACTGDSGGKVD